jgi:hypothetical protein
MHELIKLLNNNGIMWQSQYKSNELDYVNIFVEKGADVLFELETGSINRIAFYPPTQIGG